MKPMRISKFFATYRSRVATSLIFGVDRSRRESRLRAGTQGRRLDFSRPVESLGFRSFRLIIHYGGQAKRLAAIKKAKKGDRDV